MSDRTKLCLSDADVMVFMMESGFCETGIKYVAKCVSEFFSENKNNRSKFRYNNFQCDDITLEELNLFQRHGGYEDDSEFEASYVEGMNKLLEWAGFFQPQKRQPMMKTKYGYIPYQKNKFSCVVEFHVPAGEDEEMLSEYIYPIAYQTGNFSVVFSQGTLGTYSHEYETRYFSVRITSETSWNDLLEKVSNEQNKFSVFIRNIVNENNKNFANKPQDTTLFIHV